MSPSSRATRSRSSAPCVSVVATLNLRRGPRGWREARVNYSPSVKARMVRRMIGPEAIAQADLARETGIPQATLSRWCREAGNLMPVARKKKSVEAAPTAEVEKPKRPQDWTALERAEVVLKASRLSAQE